MRLSFLRKIVNFVFQFCPTNNQIIMKNKLLLIAIFIATISCNCPQKTNSVVTDTVASPVKEKVLDFPKNQILNTEQQIASAIIAAPRLARDGAKVYGYNAEGNFVVLREGTNKFICIADNPKKDGFQVVAYHSSLEPYMARGRVLDNEGKSRGEKEEIRSSEAKSGILTMPDNPATLHVYFGKNGFFNLESGEIENAKYRYVVYIPHATQETTGLSLSPNESNHPWLMFPGKYNAHIMISPKE